MKKVLILTTLLLFTGCESPEEKQLKPKGAVLEQKQGDIFDRIGAKPLTFDPNLLPQKESALVDLGPAPTPNIEAFYKLLEKKERKFMELADLLFQLQQQTKVKHDDWETIISLLGQMNLLSDALFCQEIVQEIDAKLSPELRQHALDTMRKRKQKRKQWIKQLPSEKRQELLRLTRLLNEWMQAEIERQKLIVRFQEAYPEKWRQKLLEYDIEQEKQRKYDFEQQIREINAQLEREYQQRQMIGAIESLKPDPYQEYLDRQKERDVRQEERDFRRKLLNILNNLE